MTMLWKRNEMETKNINETETRGRERDRQKKVHTAATADTSSTAEKRAMPLTCSFVLFCFFFHSHCEIWLTISVCN